MKLNDFTSYELLTLFAIASGKAFYEWEEVERDKDASWIEKNSVTPEQLTERHELYEKLSREAKEVLKIVENPQAQGLITPKEKPSITKIRNKIKEITGKNFHAIGKELLEVYS